MEGEKKKSGSRLFQLAINDAIQSRLSLVSPVRSVMEKEKMEKRKLRRVKSKLSIQTDKSEEKSSSVSSDKFNLKNWKKANNSDSASDLKNKCSGAFTKNTKNCQVQDTSQTGIIWNLGDLESKEENLTTESRRSSLLNDFECLWIPEENDSSSDISSKSISIVLNSPEWNKIESKCVSSKDSNSETSSIDYDLPVFPLSVDSESILNEEPSQKSFFDSGFNSNTSNLSLDSSELAFPNLQTPGLQFLQQSVVLNDFIPPPRVMDSSAVNTEIPAPYICDKTISRSCSPKCIGENTHQIYGSEGTLSDINNENSSSSSTFDPYLTLRHFQSMLSESPPSASFRNTVERTFSGNYPLNDTHVHPPIPKPHPASNRISGDSVEAPYKSCSNFNHLKKSCSYRNPSGLLEHFPDFKPVM